MKRMVPVIGFAVALFSSAIALAQPMLQRQESGSSTLELTPQRRQRGVPSPRVTSQPSQSVLVIPKASRDFVGEWGGHLQVENIVGSIKPPGESVVSLAFGENGGAVFMRTTAFANPLSHIVDTRANVENPRKVTVQLEGIEMAHNPPLRHVERMSLALVGKNEMDVLKYVDFYAPGDNEPIASVDYHGTLRIIDDDERRALEMEVLEQGEVPKSRIESHRSFGN